MAASALFVGRTTELESLIELLDRARAGSPQVVLTTGVAGIGKTALIREFVTSQSDVIALWASGDESESLVTFGVLDQLRRTGAVDPPPAFVKAGDVVEPWRVGAELLEWLAELAAVRPVAVVIDDAHWADEPSLHALAFALRRLVAERVMVICACRDGEALPPGLRQITDQHSRVVLEGLTEADVVALAGAVGYSHVGARAAKRLREHTGGNPLHVRALLEELDPAALSAIDTGPMAAPLPAPASFAALVLNRLAHCSTHAQSLAAAASVLGMRWRVDIAANLADLGSSGQAMAGLDELVRARLVDVQPGETPRFSHPLVQAAVYHDLSPGRRCELHAGAADLVSGLSVALRHRAAACLDHDENLAEQVAALARDDAARGAWSAATSEFLTAARLSPGSGAERLLLSAVESMISSGDAVGALALRQRVEQCRPSALREYVRGFLAAVSGERLAGKNLLERAWGRLEPSDVELAPKIASNLAMVALNEGRGNDAVEWGTRALECEPGSAEVGTAMAVRALGMGELGRLVEGIAQIGELPADTADFNTADVGGLLGRGVLRLWNDQLRAAVQDLSLAEDIARRIGPLYMRLIAMFYLAEAEYRAGLWTQAISHSDLATSLGHDAGEVWTLGLAHSVAVFPAAGQGDYDRARHHVDAAAEAAHALGDPANQLWVAVARARFAQARGDHQGVLEATSSVLDLDMPFGLQVPGIQPWALLRAEALVNCGSADHAIAVLDDIEKQCATAPHATTSMAVARLRGLVASNAGDFSAAEAQFDRAIAVARSHDVSPFERALAEFDCGSMLRRRGRRNAAATHLNRARKILVGLGAVPWLDVCDRELSACGVSPTAEEGQPRARLSPQEQAVATLVASGLTNKEIAARLVISSKTVEFHVTNLFAKFGVRNRVELATRWRGDISSPHE